MDRFRSKTGSSDVRLKVQLRSPGHAPEVLEGGEHIDFSPTEQFDRVHDHIQRAIAEPARA